MQKSSLLYFILLFVSSCQPEAGNKQALIAFEVYCEMVANDAKPIALHYPMAGKELDALWQDFGQVAQKQGVEIHREDDFPVTLLFPGEITKGKSVVLIYKPPRLKQYEQFKADLLAFKGEDQGQKEALARRFGRLLGYSPQGINELLSKNTDFQTVASFGVEGQVTHLFYEDTMEAIQFYKKTLGLKQVDSNRFQISQDAYLTVNPFDEMVGKDLPKSTAIAFLTDQLPAWYAYVQEQEVPIKYTYKPREGGPHDGFVAIDPGGYLLEFEQFKQHPENELFMAVLQDAPRIKTQIQDLNFYGSITWTYHQDLLKMQKFYEEELGYTMVADQGWTKIYQTSPSGFIGLVDERRGMEDYAKEKAVWIEWILDDWKDYAKYVEKKTGNQLAYFFLGPERYLYLCSTVEIYKELP